MTRLMPPGSSTDQPGTANKSAGAQARGVARVAGIAAPLLRDDIDTDQLFPAGFLALASIGYGAALFGSERYVDETLVENPDFILNQSPWRGAKILVAGRNFGCGSSREHAVWALRDFGIGALVAASFNDIFRDNCLRNAIVPAAVDPGTLANLVARLRANPAATVAVDVASSEVALDGDVLGRFDLPSIARQMLLAGLDEIGLALERRAGIDAFEARDRRNRPWLWRSG